MKTLRLEQNPINIQKCLLPDSDFLRENYGCHCLLSTSSTDCKLIVKIGLCETKNIEALFVDESVFKFSSLEKITKTTCLGDVSFNDFTILKKPSVAKIIKVVVVFQDVFDVPKYKNSVRLNKAVRDIFKMFTFCKNSSIILDSLPNCQKFSIYCLNVVDVVNSGANELYEINSNTEIIIENCISRLKLEQSHKDENQLQIGGCGKISSILKESIEFSKSFDKQKVKFLRKLLLIGPSGCGKKLLIRNLAHECTCILLRISPMDINALTTNDTVKKLTELFEKAKILVESKECCIILVENIDMMTTGKTPHSKRFVSHFITLLEEIEDLPGIMVIATTNCPEDVDLQLRKPKRLDDELEIMIPTEEQREEIIVNLLHHYKVEYDVHSVKQLARWTPGFVGADLQLTVMEALLISWKKKDSWDSFGEIPLQESFKEALKKVMPSALKGTVSFCTTKDTTFSQIGGLDNIKKILDLSVRQQLLNPEKFHRFGIPLTKGILLYGPPGCAKTTLVKALAKECNTTFLATSAADLYSPFVGDAEKKIVQLFTQARIGLPSIIFIDEIDAVVGSKSGDRERGAQERILSSLLMEMDGVGIKVNSQRNNYLNLLGDGNLENEDIMSSAKPMNNGVIVIGATNRPQLLDDALKRPGRFDSLLYIPSPDESERLRILEKLTEKIPLHESVDLKQLAKLTNYYSGADLKNLCQESGLLALKLSNMSAEFIHQCHFEHILKDYKPSLSDKVVNFYESFRKYNV